MRPKHPLLKLPPPPISLFVFLLTLIIYCSVVAPQMQRTSELLHLKVQACEKVPCGNQTD
jgi:hypothetical protein